MLELTNSLFYLISKTEGGCSGNRKYMIIETALYQDVLEHSSIFRQLPKDKYPNVLRCLNARVVDYPQDASIAALGDSSGCSGILLTGMLEEYLVDENGNQIIINHLRSGDVFGAESVCAGQAGQPCLHSHRGKKQDPDARFCRALVGKNIFLLLPYAGHHQSDAGICAPGDVF